MLGHPARPWGCHAARKLMPMAAVAVAACAGTSTPVTAPGLPTRTPTPALAVATPPARASAPGFKGKDCAMVAPTLSAEQRKLAKPATVRARAFFVQGVVTRVSILSGPRAYRDAVIAGMMQYTCKGAPTFAADQTFVFAFPPIPPVPKDLRPAAE